MKTIENEVVETTMINSVFQGFHILPLVYLACTVTSRHLLLRNSLGTMKIEEDALFTIWLTLGLVTMFFIIGPTLSCYLFKWTNSSLHLSFDIVADEVEKEKAEKKKCCC